MVAKGNPFRLLKSRPSLVFFAVQFHKSARVFFAYRLPNYTVFPTFFRWPANAKYLELLGVPAALGAFATVYKVQCHFYHRDLRLCFPVPDRLHFRLDPAALP